MCCGDSKPAAKSPMFAILQAPGKPGMFDSIATAVATQEQVAAVLVATEPSASPAEAFGPQAAPPTESLPIPDPQSEPLAVPLDFVPPDARPKRKAAGK